MRLSYPLVAWLLGVVETNVLALSIVLLALDTTRFKWWVWGIIASVVAMICTVAWAVDK